MGGPWERYASPDQPEAGATEEAPAGPWAKYAIPASDTKALYHRDIDTEARRRQTSGGVERLDPYAAAAYDTTMVGLEPKMKGAAEATIAKALSLANGKDVNFSDVYARERDIRRRQTELALEEGGWGATGARIVSSAAFAPKAVTGAVAAAASEAPGLASSLFNASKGGAMWGGAYGFNKSDADISDKLASAGEGAVEGALTAPALVGGLKATGWGAGKLSEAIGPTVARWKANVADIPSRIGMHLSADGAVPESAGATAAAEQIIANQLQRSGKTVEDLRGTLDAADRARTFHSNSRAQDVLAPVDLDTGLQRLAGSVGRSSPEAASSMQAFQHARQTGLTPNEPLASTAGLPTRDMLARPDADAPPMGMYERVKDALKRALLIRDEGSHGHGVNAYRTEQQIIADAKTQAADLYGQTYKAGDGVDVSQAIAPVLEKWQGTIGQGSKEAVPVRNAIQEAIDLFKPDGQPVGHIEAFDRTKQYLDNKIEGLVDKVKGTDRYLGGRLSQLKNDLLAAVDQIKANGLGEKYAAARDAFGSNMEMREALNLGRDVFRENSDVVADQFKALPSVGQQKLFRLGALDSFEQHIGKQKRTADVTQVFENPRVQSILDTIIPRTETATGRAKIVNGEPAAFADRPERFGAYLGNEKRTVDTRNEVFGNSKTAQRQVDDQAFETLNSVIENFKSSPSVANLGFRAAQAALNKVFGYRADTAASIARQLFTADPVVRARVLRNIEARMGTSRMAQFNNLMQQFQARAATIAQSGPGGGGSPPQQGGPDRPPGMMRLGGPSNRNVLAGDEAIPIDQSAFRPNGLAR